MTTPNDIVNEPKDSHPVAFAIIVLWIAGMASVLIGIALVWWQL